VVVVKAVDPWTKKEKDVSRDEERKSFMSHKIDKIRKAAFSSEGVAVNKYADRDEAERISSELRADARKIEDLGASVLQGRTRQLYERKWLERIGAVPPKQEKVAYDQLQRAIKKQKAAREKQHQLDLVAGNMIHQPMMYEVKKKDKREKMRGISLGMGKFANGKVRLAGDEISKIKRSSIKRRI
jgi:hypothetical protein